VVSVLCRMTFDFALWSEGKIPVTLVCEEAHRYVPANDAMGFEPCKRAIAKIAKEGRKYGASLCIVTQRPAEIDPTILSQCNTVFALRMSNDRDQAIVHSAVSDTGSGLLEFLPALGQREAIAFGDGVSLPVRIKFDELKKECLPRSSTARFSERWQASIGDENFLEQIVERWRTAGLGGADEATQMAMFAEAMGLSPAEAAAHVQAQTELADQAAAALAAQQAQPQEGRPGLRQGSEERMPQRLREGGALGSARAAQMQPGQAAQASAQAQAAQGGGQAAPGRPDATQRQLMGGKAGSLRRAAAAAGGAARGQPAEAGQEAPQPTLRNLRDRLMQRR
jgi:DNA segregation ATPase FtsK/SpoIIIE-like protein